MKPGFRYALFLCIYFGFTSLTTRAREFFWNGVGIVSLQVPQGWSVVNKTNGEEAYMLQITAPSRKAEMAISFVQHAKASGDELKYISERFQEGLQPLLLASKRKFSPATLKLKKGVGLMAQFSAAELQGSAPLSTTGAVLRRTASSIDARCMLVTSMQMDAPGSVEAEDMMALLTQATLQRLQPYEGLELTETLTAYVISTPPSGLRMKIPRGDFVRMTSMERPTSRYFYFINPSDLLTLSGWVENGRSYEGVEGFWAAENKDNRLGATNVSIEKLGGWDIVIFDVPLPAKGGVSIKAVNTHMRAEYAAKGTWIDVHVSTTSESSHDKNRKKLIALLRRLKIEEKEPEKVPPLSPLDEGQRAELKAALADLTVQIDTLDDAGFAKAVETMLVSLLRVAPGHFDYPEECLVWKRDAQGIGKTAEILTTAFTAAVVRERVFGTPEQALHRGWLNVIKYYQHYRTEGSMPELKGVEKLLDWEKRGALEEQANRVQAMHAAQFGHLEL